MGLHSSRSREIRQRSQVIHHSELANSSVQFSSKQKNAHSYFLNTTISYRNRQLQIEDYLSNLIKTGNLVDTSNLYLPLGWEQYSGEMCQQIRDLDLYYPVYTYFLRNEIEARRFTAQGFSQQQVWYMLMSILNGLRQFEKINMISTPLSVDSVRMNQSGLIKIQNGLSTPSLYDQILESKRYRSSPLDFQVNQSYKLGLIILEVCTFPHTDFPSNIDTFQLNQMAAQKYLKLMSYNYSDLLCTLVTVMLSSFSDRPLPSQIYQIFAPFKRQIMAFKPFDFSVSAMRNSITQSKVTIPNGAFSMYMSKPNNNFHTNNNYNQNSNFMKNTNPIIYKELNSRNQYNYNNNNPSQYGHVVNSNVLQNSNQYLSPISYQNRNYGAHY